MRVLFCVGLFYWLSNSMSAQERVDSPSEYFSFLSSIPKNHLGIIIISDRKCGECLLASDESYLSKLDSTLRFPLGTVNADSDFGEIISMKYRINRIPVMLMLSNEGQLLQRVHSIPKEINDAMSLEKPFDTLPMVKSPLVFRSDYPVFFKQSFDKKTQTEPSDEVLELFFRLNPNLQDEITWAVAMRFDLSDEMMNRIIVERDSLIASYGKDEVFEKLDQYFFTCTKRAAKDRSQTQFESAIAKAELAFGSDHFLYSSKYKSYFYQLTGDWNGYINLGNEIKSNDEMAPETLIEMATVLLRYCQDVELLKAAAGWFSEEISPEKVKGAEIRAGLLWQGGDKEGAKALAKKIKSHPTYSPPDFPYTSFITKDSN